MPELPEVETVRRGLNKLIQGKTISTVQVFYPPMIRTGVENFIDSLKGLTVEKVGRRGKYLLFYLGDGLLISHLRMEGKFLLEDKMREPKKHQHLFFEFTDGSLLVYEDVRKFGTMEWMKAEEEESYFQKKKLGPEPQLPDFDLAVFKDQVLRMKGPIKSSLLNQKLVVGLGNIYVDEVLFRAGIHPLRTGESLSDSDISRLHEQVIKVLELAVSLGGSTIRTYRNAFGEDGTMQAHHLVYAKTGQACPNCGREIEKIKVGGRGTHFCPQCQKL